MYRDCRNWEILELTNMDSEATPLPGLKRLSQGTVFKMLSQQTLPTLLAMVKELVENALDAGSPSVQVTLSEYGTSYLEVRDQGSGIVKESLELMCQFGGTSKIREYEDLHQGVQGFGFRGEGLAAIRVVSDIEVTSRVKGAGFGYKAIYRSHDDQPTIIEVKNCPEGTCIRVDKPFLRDRMKREDLIKHSVSIYKQVVEQLQTYAVIFPLKKFELHHFHEGRNNTVFSFLKESTVLQRITDVFGYEIGSLIGVKEATDDDITARIYLSYYVQSGSFKATTPFKKADIRLAINSRPADISKSLKAMIDRMYTEYNPKAKYFIYLFLQVPDNWVDFNLAKDKREVRIQNRDRVDRLVSKAIKDYLEEKQQVKVVDQADGIRSRFEERLSGVPGSSSKSPGPTFSTPMSLPTPSRTPSQQSESKPSASPFHPPQSATRVKDDPQFAYPNPVDLVRQERPLTEHGFEKIEKLESITPSSTHNYTPKSGFARTTDMIPKWKLDALANIKKPQSSSLEEASVLSVIDSQENSQSCCSEFSLGPKTDLPNKSNLRRVKVDEPQIQDSEPAEMPAKRLRLDMEEPSEPQNAQNKFKKDFLQRLHASELNQHQERFLQKDFTNLRVIGQFNKGFIICKWKEGDGRYLIVDQHAADEKANYERLQRDLKVNIQTLISPMVVNLPLSSLMVLEENIKIFEDNGFQLQLKADHEKNSFQVLITGVPNIFFWKYSQEDFMDLLYLVKNHSAYLEDIMIPKAKRELATKACRLSTKIGDPLVKSSMEDIVKKLGELKHPWNCPHGRPSTIIADCVREPKLNKSSLKGKLKVII